MDTTKEPCHLSQHTNTISEVVSTIQVIRYLESASLPDAKVLLQTEPIETFENLTCSACESVIYTSADKSAFLDR